MACLSRLCTILLVVVSLLFLLEFCSSRSDSTTMCTAEGLDSVDPSAAALSGNQGDPMPIGSLGQQPSANIAPTSSDGSSLDQYFAKGEGEAGGNNAVFTVKPPSAAEENGAINQFGKQMAEDIGKNSFNVKDFLPQEINTEWFQTDLSTATESLDAAALIDISKFCQGVDTVGQSLKNPSYDIRGNIPNPKIVVSPFLNSSYDPDTNIKSWA